MKTGTKQLKLLTSHTPRHNFDAFPFGLYEYTPAAEAAMYYGFTPVRNLTPNDIEPVVKDSIDNLPFYFTNDKSEKLRFNFQEKAELIKMYREDRFPTLPTPVMLFFEKPLAQLKAKPGNYKHQCSLECLGVKRAIAEALIIQTSCAILEEEGFKGLTVEINSTGNTESKRNFELALTQYVRSMLPFMTEAMRTECRQNPYALYSFSNPVADRLLTDAPQPITYLSEAGREHLSEVLEYLESLNIPYSIRNDLLANKDLQSQIIFRIVDEGRSNRQEILSCQGMRYTPAGRKLGFRRETPAVGAQLNYTTPINKKPSRKRKIDPRFCFVHLGFEAKLKSLQIINMLRRRRIPLCHSLTRDKLAPQMSVAERLKLPYLIIMGQKEALEDTVLVRDIEDRSQEVVPVNDLPNYLRQKKNRSS